MTKPRIAPLTMEPWIIDDEQQEDDNGLPCWVGSHPDYPTGDKWFSCPFGGVGDRLWVRETWAVDAPLDQVRREYEDVMGGIGHGPYYRADKVHEGTGLTWRPSIHMPRWACRLLLEIVSVRVERLQDISEADARAEGVELPPCVYVGHCNSSRCPRHSATAYRDAFARLWDELYATRGYSWENNPFVWAITYRRLPL